MNPRTLHGPYEALLHTEYVHPLPFHYAHPIPFHPMPPPFPTSYPASTSSFLPSAPPTILMDEQEMNSKEALLEMGFSEVQVMRALEACGNESSIFELADFIQAHGSSPTRENQPYSEEKKDAKETLLEMGFPENQVVHAVEVCGGHSSVFELSDFIQAHGNNLDVKILDKEGDVESGDRYSNVGGELNLEETLLEMGFSKVHVKHALEVCGDESSVFELSDFIQAHGDDLVKSCGRKETEQAHSNLTKGGDAESKMQQSRICGGSDLKDQNVHNFNQNDMKQTGCVEDCMPDEEHVMGALLEMGFSKAQVKRAMKACGKESSIFVLTDFIEAHFNEDEMNDGFHTFGSGGSACATNCSNGISVKSESSSPRSDNGKIKLKRIWDEREVLDEETEFTLPSTSDGKSTRNASVRKRKFHPTIDSGSMNGFDIPGYLPPLHTRRLDAMMVGPPFFYFENVVVSKSAWSTIQRHFHGVEPEFVDSKYFSCSKRARGYVHNLPTLGRELIIPEPPLTIMDAFPEKVQYWPIWDNRIKLETITKRRASERKCNDIREMMAQYRGRAIPLLEQQEIMSICKEFNLIWVAPGEVANLEVHEIEMILGLEEDHTRGAFTTAERLEALENAFQVNTIGYHLSPLRTMFPDGIRVLSLFSGIGGAEVALHKIGIFLKYVVCVEIKDKCRNVIESWWKKTKQKGILIFKNDVQNLTYDVLSSMFEEIGGFDLIIGSSPCSDPSGGQNEADCRLFYEFPRILNIVKQLTSDATKTSSKHGVNDD